MPVTDLHPPVPFAPSAGRRPTGTPAGGDGAAYPSAPGAGSRLVYAAGADDAPMPPPPTLWTERAAELLHGAPIPSRAVAMIGGLALLSFALVVALAATVATDDGPPPPVETVAPAPSASATAEAALVLNDFPEPPPIPAEVMARLEAASGEPLAVELERLLEAIGYGFAEDGARLAPELRTYTYRMASRFAWNPGTYAIAVTAPSESLADARAALLVHLFEDAVTDGRLRIGSDIGPHALTLVTQ